MYNVILHSFGAHRNMFAWSVKISETKRTSLEINGVTKTDVLATKYRDQNQKSGNKLRLCFVCK